MNPKYKLFRRILACFCLVAFVILCTQVQNTVANNKKPYNPYFPKAKNVIVMIADGAGFNQYLAADYYQYGKKGKQVYERFPVRTAVSTYEYEWKTWDTNTSTTPPTYTPTSFEILGYDSEQYWTDFGYAIQTNPLNPAYMNTSTDSASAATAMATGFKTKDGAIGFVFDKDMNYVSRPNIVEYAEGLGKATGLVTSVPFSHATPAGFGAHNVNRDNYAAIANQLIYSSGLEVLMGCSAPDFGYNGEAVTPSSSKLKYVGGVDTWADISDGSVLGSDADGDGIMDEWSIIRDQSQFQAMATGPTPKRVMGIPKVYQSLQYYRNPIYSKADAYTEPFIPNIPTLSEMAKAALNVLDNDKNGFFLMVEGGAVDWAAHFYQPGRMVEEMIDFNLAVEAVVDWVNANSNWGETMLIVTADHETSYLWGPAADPANPQWEPIVNNGVGAMPGMQFYSDIGGFGWHSNSLVPLYAKGNAAMVIPYFADKWDRVRGPYIDNTDIFAIVRWAMK